MNEKTEYFTDLAKTISQVGSVMLLDAMEEKDVENFVYQEYKSIVEEDLRNMGLFDKIKQAVSKVWD